MGNCKSSSNKGLIFTNSSKTSTSTQYACTRETRSSRSSKSKTTKHKNGRKSKHTTQKPRQDQTRLGSDFVVKSLEATATPAFLTAMRWVDANNKHDMMRLYQVSDHDAVFHFPAMNVDLPMRSFWNSMMTLFDAVPDLTFSFTSVEEVEPGVIVFENYCGAGHHTGNYLEFDKNPPIPPTGAYIADGPIRFAVTVKGNKVVDTVAETFDGGVAGPPGFYVKAKQAHDIAAKLSIESPRLTTQAMF